MTEEENKAIEYLKHILIGTNEPITNGKVENAVKTLLNLIEKLQEENKELKDKKTLVHIDEKGNIEPILGKYIPIEDLEEVIENRAFDIKDYLTVIDVDDLKELLKEE